MHARQQRLKAGLRRLDGAVALGQRREARSLVGRGVGVGGHGEPSGLDLAPHGCLQRGELGSAQREGLA
jgi:hypothetical protein